MTHKIYLCINNMVKEKKNMVKEKRQPCSRSPLVWVLMADYLTRLVTVRVTLVVYALSAPAASYALTRYCTLVHP